MALIHWRRFNFFNKQVVEPNTGGRTWDTIMNSFFTASTCGRGFLVFGDSQGFIHMANHNYQVSTFQAFSIAVTHLFQLKEHNILAAIGIDEQGINPVIKVFNLDKQDKVGNYFCCRVQPTIPQNNVPSDVTSFCVHENLTLMVVGFSEGSVNLYKGDVAKERPSNKILYLSTDSKDPVTGLSFYGSGKYNCLFASTETRVLSFNLQEKYPKMNILDNDRGCAEQCSMLSDVSFDNQFVVTGTDAVYLYQSDSRGPCFVFEGEKLMSKWYNGYLILVYKDKNKVSIPSTSSVQIPDSNLVAIYDMKQKLLAFSAPLSGVKEILYEWGSIFILTAGNRLVCFQEIDIHQKLELLFKKNLYSLAVNLARSQNLGEEGMVEIYRQYGDHLYSRADFDSSIEQYKKTIGHFEPSYIIRKFLDAQRINNLTSYLQELHERGLANEDHTTLLLNCFTKLKDEKNLNKFIMMPDSGLMFDVETAIKVCRHAGYFKHSLELAQKHKKHQWYIKIQLEDTHNYEKALSYILNLDHGQAENTLKQYGKILMNNVPEKTTALLEKLCTDFSLPTEIDNGDFTEIGSVYKSNGEEFIHIFVNSPDMIVRFLEHLINVGKVASEGVFNTLLELHLSKFKQTKQVKELEKKILKLLKELSLRNYSTDQALILCQMQNFCPGILQLYEENGLFEQILHFHMENQAFSLILETCEIHGRKDATLWQQALTYYAQHDNCQEYITKVLNHIDENNLLPPLLVIQLLARNSSATLAVVKDYILRQIRHEREEIRRYETSITEYKEQTKKMKDRIEQLRTSATIFQETRCSYCKHELELPTVHFLCQHAYHQNCLENYSENDADCPICVRQNQKIINNIREQEQALANSISLHDQFKSQLRSSKDGFDVVADFFSKGVFNKLTVVKEDERGYNAVGLSKHGIDPSLQKELLMMQQSNTR